METSLTNCVADDYDHLIMGIYCRDIPVGGREGVWGGGSGDQTHTVCHLHNIKDQPERMRCLVGIRHWLRFHLRKTGCFFHVQTSPFFRDISLKQVLELGTGLGKKGRAIWSQQRERLRPNWNDNTHLEPRTFNPFTEFTILCHL